MRRRLSSLGHVMERAHVVQPVGELDQQHADVVAQREQELAQIFGGALIFRLRLDLAAAWSPRRPAARRWAPNNFSICSGVATVSSIVSWRIAVTIVSSSSLRSVRMPGDFDRVAEIGVARGADLGAMRLHREDIGAVDQRLRRHRDRRREPSRQVHIGCSTRQCGHSGRHVRKREKGRNGVAGRPGARA